MHNQPSATREDLRRRVGIGIAAPMFAALAYSTATTIFVSGLWRPKLLVIGIAAWISSRYVLRRLPRLLVLRRFGSRHTEEFIRIVGGGSSGHFRPVWISDFRSDAHLRHGLPGLWLYLMRPITWICLGWFIASSETLNHYTALLWIAWMLVATLSYHRFACGLPSPPWIATLIAGATSIFYLSSTGPTTYPLQVQSWTHFFFVIAIFFIVRLASSILIYKVVPRTKLKRLFSARFIETAQDLNDFIREIRGHSIRHRFTPLVPTQVSEIAATDEFWATAIYESIGASSVVIVDVTGIDRQACIGWELEQVYMAGPAIVLTCEADDVEAAQETLRSLGFPPASIMSWCASDLGSSPSKELCDRLSRFLYDSIRSHVARDLGTLAPRPPLVHALARLQQWEKGMVRLPSSTPDP
jgi:hypothetical protein